jgi:hypothetical protein
VDVSAVHTDVADAEFLKGVSVQNDSYVPMVERALGLDPQILGQDVTSLISSGSYRAVLSHLCSWVIELERGGWSSHNGGTDEDVAGLAVQEKARESLWEKRDLQTGMGAQPIAWTITTWVALPSTLVGAKCLGMLRQASI